MTVDMDYNFKTIRIDVAGVGTLGIMEWIRDNGCPNLDHTIFEDARGKYVAMVSKGNESMFRATLTAIDGNYYWATR